MQLLHITTNHQCLSFKQHYTHHNGHIGLFFRSEKKLEIKLVRPTEVCGKVESVIDADHQNKQM